MAVGRPVSCAEDHLGIYRLPIPHGKLGLETLEKKSRPVFLSLSLSLSLSNMRFLNDDTVVVSTSEAKKTLQVIAAGLPRYVVPSSPPSPCVHLSELLLCT